MAQGTATIDKIKKTYPYSISLLEDRVNIFWRKIMSSRANTMFHLQYTVFKQVLTSIPKIGKIRQ